MRIPTNVSDFDINRLRRQQRAEALKVAETKEAAGPEIENTGAPLGPDSWRPNPDIDTSPREYDPYAHLREKPDLLGNNDGISKSYRGDVVSTENEEAGERV